MKLLSKTKGFLYILSAAFLLSLMACSPSVATPSTDISPSAPETNEEQSTSTSSNTDEAPEIEWLSPTEDILNEWLVALDTDNPFKVSLSQKNEIDTTDDTQQILFLYTKGHRLFDKAVGQVLSIFLEKSIPVEASIILAGEDEAVFNALDYAEATGVDLIYTMGSSSTAFIHDNYRNGEIPVVTLLSKDPVLLGQANDYESGSGTNIAYTSVGMPVELQMSYFQTLVPNLKNIVILYDQDNTSTITTQVDPLDIYAKEAGINLIHVAAVPTEDGDVTEDLKEKMTVSLAKINGLDPKMEESIVLVTGSGSVVAAFGTVNVLAGNVPVVSLFPDLVQEGPVSAVLSVGVSFDSNAILAALYGVQILQENIVPGEMPVGVITPPDVAISFAKAREIGLKIPFAFFESAAFVYDTNGVLVRDKGQLVE